MTVADRVTLWWRSKQLIHALLTRPLLLFIILYAVVIVGRWTYYQFAPRSAFFEYYDVTAAEFLKDGTLVLESDRVIRHAGIYEFRDDLECKRPEGGWETMSRTLTRAPAASGPRLDPPVRWSWPGSQYLFNPGGRLPSDAVCRVEASIRLELPFGVVRTQVIQGSPFRVP